MYLINARSMEHIKTINAKQAKATYAYKYTATFRTQICRKCLRIKVHSDFPNALYNSIGSVRMT
jgi:restriction endonuclease